MNTSFVLLRLFILSAAIVALSLGTPAAQAAESPIVRITGSTTVEKALLEPNRERIRIATGIALDLKCKGTGEGLLSLVKGRADASGSSETLEDAIKGANERAKEKNDRTKLPDNFTYTELARDRIVVVVNAKNTAIKKLNKKQLADIFTQKIVNWKELGGNDEPIIVYLSPTGSATRSLFQKSILDGAEFPVTKDVAGAHVLSAYSTASETDNVARAPNSIAAVSESVLHDTNVKIVETPTIERPLGIITLGKPAANVEKVISYLRSIQGLK